MRVYVLRWNGLNGPAVFDNIQDVRDEINAMLDPENIEHYKPGAGFSLKVDEMSEEEYADLPDFDGY